MFDRIAGLYDRMNTVMTAGLHHEWRRRATDLAELSPGGRALDVATGTGDLALELARRVGAGGEVVGVDFSERMLELARAKAEETAASLGGAGVLFETGNALALAYPDGAFDAATVGFGARNFSDLDRGLSEMARVVRPGGRVVVLEITTPRRPPLSTLLRCLVRPHRPGGRPGGRFAGLQLSAELGQAIPGPRGARRRDVAIGAARYSLRAHRRGHHRLTRGNGPDLMTTGAQAVVDAGGEELTRIMDRVERENEGARCRSRTRARAVRRRHDLRRRQAPAPAARVHRGGRAAARDRRAGPRRGRGRARARGDARPRRRARRLRAPSRAPDRRRHRRPRPRDRHRRPAVLARVRRARRRRIGPRGADPVPGQPGACARRARATRGCVQPRGHRQALPRPLPAEDRGPVPSGLRARSARGRRRARGARRVRRADRPRVPDPRRRPRRVRPPRAHRQAARSRPARRHGQPAADPCPRPGSRARRARPADGADAR